MGRFFEQLQRRGLYLAGIELVVSDGTNGLPSVLQTWVPQAQHQRCITHKVRALLRHLEYEQLPTHDPQGQPLCAADAKRLRFSQVQSDAYDIYDTDDCIEACERLASFVQSWKPIEPKAVKSFLNDILLTFSFYDLEAALYPLVRTTNALERFFREFRTKTDEIGAFPNENSCLTLFFLVIQREHAKHDRL